MVNSNYLPLVLTLLACGACGGRTTVPQTPATPEVSSAETHAAVAKTEAPTPPAATAPDAPEEATTTPPPAASGPESCDEGWVCIRVALDGSRKIEKRATKLIGDPAITETWSATTDGRKPAAFDGAKDRTAEVVLRRKGGNKAELVLRTGTPGKPVREMVVDTHEGEFTYVGVIATEEKGSLLVDIRYMK